VGAFVGSFILPRFADVVGRKPMFLLGLAIYFCVLIGVLFCRDFYLMCALIFFGGIAETGRYYVAYVYLVEFVPDRRQSVAGLMIFVVFGVAQMYFAAYFSMLTKTWDYLAYQGLLFTLFAFCACHFWLPETPRFLYSKGHYDQARQVLHRMLQTNKKEQSIRYVFEKQLKEGKA
jgi:MFS family permease